MLVWSIPYFIYSLFNGVNILKSFVFLLIGGFSVYYFIVLIIQYYILLPSLQSLSNIIGSGKMVLYSSLIFLICMVALFILTKVLDYSFPLVAYAENKIKISRNKLLILTFLGLIISIFETYLTISYTGRFTGLGIKTGAFIYSFTVILFLFSLDTNKSFNSTLWRGIVYIGNISFGIYLIHMYFLIYLVRPIINYLPTNNWAIDQFLIITITLGLCVTMIDVSKKINFNFAKKYFGF